MSKYPWGRAVVINLESRPDRLNAFSRGAAEHGVDFDVWKAQEEPLGAIGCHASHRAILEALRDSRDESWAIFEDDCLFVDDFEERFHQFFNTVPIGWDALWLGGAHQEQPLRLGGGVSLISNVRLSHAYVVSFRAVDSLLSVRPQGMPGMDHVDAIWSRTLSGRKLTYSPELWLCGQSAGYSDITKTNLKERWG